MPLPPEEPDVPAAYDLWAETYDSISNRTRELAGRLLRRSGLPLEGRDVVELGCGTGSNTEWIAASARSVLALDLSDRMLSRARARVRLPGVRFVRHDIRAAWPVAPASMEVAVAMLVLEHVERLEPVFREAASALREGGILWICELHPERQALGRRAEFTDPGSGRPVTIAAFPHALSEFVDDGRRAGLEPKELLDWRDPEDAPEGPPRLLTVRYRLSP